MAVQAIGDYEFDPKDKLENFHGNMLTYWNWVDHLMFCAPIALPLGPDMPFGAVVSDVFPGAYGYHPDFEEIDWDSAEWTLDDEPFTPQFDKSLADNGLQHKSVVRFLTPGLVGISGTAT